MFLDVQRSRTLPLRVRSALPAGGRRGMKCPRCQHENGPRAKFCQECAASLARTCSKCGNELPLTAKFCPECAHPAGSAGTIDQGRFSSPESYTPGHLAERILTSKSALEGERKHVTVLFGDLKGSMEL